MMPPDDITTRLRHLAVDYSQNEHLPDEAWLIEAADTIDALRAALDDASSVLAAVDADANNVQLDIARWRRQHNVADPLRD